MMKLYEFEAKDPKSMTKEELEQSCMQLLEEINDILDVAHDRIQKEKYAKTN